MTRTDKILEWLKNNKVISIIVVLGVIIAGFAATLKNVNEIAKSLGFDSARKSPSRDTIYPTIPPSQIKGIATSLLKENPEFYGYQNIYGEDYVLTFTKSNERFTLFRGLNGLWEDVQHIDSLNAMNMFSGPGDWEFTTIDSLPTLFFATGSFGNTFGSIEFYLIPFRKDFSYEVYKIDVSGRLSGSDSGTFDNSDYDVARNDLARQNNNFSRYLEKKFNQYNPVSELTDKDADLENPKNALKAWEVDNADWLKRPAIDNDSIVRLRSDYRIKFKYFKENLPLIIQEVDPGEPDDENEYFRLYHVFKYASIVQDKKSGNYFVALGYRSWSMGRIELRNETLYASGSWYFDEPFLINLRTGAITILPKEKDN